MRRSAWQSLAAISLTALAALAPAETRPRYGGTLVIEIHDSLTLTDPAEWPIRLVPLVYDRLVRLDSTGAPQPGLAISWEHDVASKRWEFRLRSHAMFHDGTPLTAAAAAACLKLWSNTTRSITPAGPDVLIFQSETSMPDLPVRLAGARYAILLRGINGVTVGAGPFRIAEWQPGKRALLAANESYWDGRPFVDFIEVQMARAYRDQSIDLELAKADLVEISMGDVRRAAQRAIRTWISAPGDLVALVFERGRIAAADVRTREGVALSIDRAAIQNVLLDRQGESTGAALPGWLSGYAFLFPAARDIERARQLAAESVKPGTRLSLAYDPADPLARPIAERIALNAREVGIGVQTTPAVRGDLRLMHYRLRSLDPTEALGEVAAGAGLELQLQSDAITPEALFAAERKLLEDFRVTPLFHLPEIYGLSLRVKNWDPQPWGDWRLDNVWLEARKP